MRKLFLLLFGFAFLACGQVVVAQAQGQAPQASRPAAQANQPQTVNAVLERTVTRLEKLFGDLADAMPEDKYDFVPTTGEYKGVRNFASQVKHVGAGNYEYFAAMLGEKPPAEAGGEDGPATAKSKADILKFLRASFAYAHKAVAGVNDKNLMEPVKAPFGSGTTTRLALALGAVSHVNDHYGQLVEYLRLNGIVPPASRGGQ